MGTPIILGPTLLPCFLFAFVSILIFRIRPGKYLLAGLNIFTLASSASAAPTQIPTPARGAGRGGGAGGGSAKKRAAPKAQQVVDSGSGLTLNLSRITEGTLDRLEFYDAFEIIVHGMLALGLVLAVQLAVDHFDLLGRAVNRFTLSHMLPLLTLFILFSLFSSEFLHPAVQSGDRIAVGLLGAALAIAALAAVGLSPQGALALDLRAAAKELWEGWLPSYLSNERLQIAHSAISKALGAVDAPVLAAGAALLGGAAGGLMLGPAWRYGRLLTDAVAPRPWMLQYARLTWRQVLTVQLGLALNLAVCGLWIGPLADALLLPPAALDRVRLAVLGAAALANLLSVRPLVQSYLNLGFVNWFVIRHAAGADEASKAREINRQSKITLVFAGKVALQMIFLPALQAAALGLLLLHTLPSAAARRAADEAAARAAELAAAGGGGGGSGAAEAAPDLADIIRGMLPELSGPPKTPAAAAAAAAAAAWAARPSALFAAAAGFLAWWPTCVWCALSAFSLLLVRSGVVAGHVAV